VYIGRGGRMMGKWKTKFNANYYDGFESELNFEERFVERNFDEFTDQWDDEKPIVWKEHEYYAPYLLSQSKK
jgi:hypothetical protein